jgi:hypothetical protein
LKKFIPIILFLLGAIEIFYGILFGRLRIYAHEAAFAQALRLQDLSSEQQRAYNHYIDLFQDQWRVVAVFGVITVVAAVVLWFLEKRKMPG